MSEASNENIKRGVFHSLGARNYATHDRQIEDYYATEPKAVDLLLNEETFSHNILEPMCGGGHIAEVLKANGYEVVASDKVNRGYGIVKDLFDYTCWGGDIISNPPYKGAVEYVRHCLDIVDDGHKVAMFLKVQFLEGKARRKFFEEHPPKIVYVSSRTLHCAMNGDFVKYKKCNAVTYCWFIWEKGFKGEPIIRWIN